MASVGLDNTRSNHMMYTHLHAFDALFVAPWRNYAAWWLFSFAVLWGFEAVRFKARNQGLLRYWLFQLGFFVLLNILV